MALFPTPNSKVSYAGSEEDFLQLKNSAAQVIAGIDSTGASYGSLAIGQTGPVGPSNSNSSILYVTPNGNDANDGLTWATAKTTIFGAAIALPGGSAPNQSGSGVIYFASGSSANPTANAGLWIMGANDPNFATPPAGWLKAPSGSLQVTGIPIANHGPNPHLGRAHLIAGASDS
ncbi:MAG: hypothetical protein ACREQ5_06915, partial [Candidatus Dormibacteria bacterium]